MIACKWSSAGVYGHVVGLTLDKMASLVVVFAAVAALGFVPVDAVYEERGLYGGFWIV